MTSELLKILHTKILINVFRNLELGFQGVLKSLSICFSRFHSELSEDLYLGHGSSELIFKHLYCQISAIC